MAEGATPRPARFVQLTTTARSNVKHFLAFSEEAPPTILRYFMLVFAGTLIVRWFKGQLTR